MRGVHLDCALSTVSQKGSSPHTRGLLVIQDHDFVVIRIIPAYAGSTDVLTIGQHSREDHPRIRGVYNPGALQDCRGLGSSPHTRGLHIPYIVLAQCIGIIPAYAGSTSLALIFNNGIQDHPRIRGVYTKKSPKKRHS